MAVASLTTATSNASSRSPRLARAVDRILEDPGAHHTVDSLADVASRSRSAFAERFSSAFELPPMRLGHHIRVQRAAHLLRQGDELSIDAVAERVGFSSRGHSFCLSWTIRNRWPSEERS